MRKILRQQEKILEQQEKILEQQEKIADTSISLEMQRIKAELDWEKVHNQRETEPADDNIRAMYQLREHEILSQLMQLENKAYDIEQENLTLREQLDEYQRREREEADKMVASKDSGVEGERQRLIAEQANAARELSVKRARIAAMNEQRDLLDKTREALEADRKRKLAEAREKRKPDLDKDSDGDTVMTSPSDSPGAAAINRSHSSPSLVVVVSSDEDECTMPSVDHSTKPTKVAPSTDMQQRDFKPVWGDVAAAVQYEERARSMRKILRQQEKILEQQEKIADTSISLEMQRIKAELDWEKVHNQRETEPADDNIRAMYQLREHEILSQLMQLENKAYDIEQENLTLREQLDEYQRREREEADKMVASKDSGVEGERQRLIAEQANAARELSVKRARIAAMNEQRDLLDKTREALEADRKRKLAEAREKRKPDLDKDSDGDTVMTSPSDSPGAAAINRSHSSPSLVVVVSSDEDECTMPSVDHSTKPTKVAPSTDMQQRDFKPVWGDVAAAVQYEERARSMRKILRQQEKILEQQEKIADTSISLEMQRIKAELDWEKVHNQRETEPADDNIRAMYQLREHEILSQLMQLENKAYDIEQENLTLREQLDEYQRREREEADKMVASKDSGVEGERQRLIAEQANAARELSVKRARIAEMNEQRDLLDKTREALEADRKRKLAEAREKRKPDLDKAAAVQYEERARSMRKILRQQEKILEQQEKIADTSISLEMQRIKAELDWEKVHNQRETEPADDNIRAMYQLREHEILSQLMQLENKAYDIEQENLTLREQLDEYQRREREEADKMVASKDSGVEGERQRLIAEQANAARELSVKRARIAAMNEQRDLLDKTREALEADRKRKLAEAREKRKPDLDKDSDGDTVMTSPSDSPGAAAINRSHSSPSLVVVVSSDEDECTMPSVDHSTKPTKVAPSTDMQQRDFKPVWGDVAAAVQYEERARSMRKILRQQEKILEQQEKIADTSISLEMQRIKAELDWEKVHNQRETEPADDNIRAMYQLREHEILSQLMQLENKAYDIEQENLTLREQLDEYQRREREEADKMVASKDSGVEGERQRLIAEQANAARELSVKRARIAAMNEQRDLLDKTREALEADRKRKLAEAREKRKPDLDKKKMLIFRNRHT